MANLKLGQLDIYKGLYKKIWGLANSKLSESVSDPDRAKILVRLDEFKAYTVHQSQTAKIHVCKVHKTYMYRQSKQKRQNTTWMTAFQECLCRLRNIAMWKYDYRTDTQTDKHRQTDRRRTKTICPESDGLVSLVRSFVFLFLHLWMKSSAG